MLSGPTMLTIIAIIIILAVAINVNLDSKRQFELKMADTRLESQKLEVKSLPVGEIDATLQIEKEKTQQERVKSEAEGKKIKVAEMQLKVLNKEQELIELRAKLGQMREDS